MSDFAIYSVFYLLSIVGIFTIAFFTLAKYRKGDQLYFGTFTLLVASWLAFQFISQLLYQNTTVAMFFLRLASATSCLIAVTFLYFVLYFTERKKLPRKYMGVVLFAPLLLTPLGIKQANITQSGIAVNEVGVFYLLNLLVVTIYFLVGIFLLIRQTSTAKTIEIRQRNTLLIIAIAQAVFFTVGGSFLLADNMAGQILLPISLLVLVFIISYTIIVHRLFDIRLVVARTVAYSLLIATLAAVYFVVVLEVTNFLVPEDASNIKQTVPLIVAIFVTASAPYFKRFFDKLTNRLFYRDAYEPQIFLDDLNKALVGEIEMEKLLDAVTRIMEENLKSSYVAVGVRETEMKPLRIIGASAPKYKEEEIKYVRAELLRSGQKTVISAEIPEEMHKVRDIFRKNDIDIIVRLLTSYDANEEAIAYLILGPKKSGNIYNKQDIQILGIISDELVIAIQNALRFEEIQEFAVTLQQKVDEATARLRRTNEKLKELDDTKDEFISMASHQLRTPLTSVKGYLSMVLEGDAGAIKPQQKQLLEQSFLSAQRMVYIIADLLNVSRLKTGKFVLDINPTDLTDVIKGELDQLTEAFKSKKLKLNYEKPKDFPMLLLDETKTRQVIMNFIDNAIYYTPAGGKIDVSLTQDKKHTYFRVKDNGLGVPKTEQPHLFTKFYRASNARKARPDGTGLGLFMAKKVIVAQGGTILFETQEGKGSTFGFCFETAKLLPEPKKPLATATKV